MHRNVGFYHLCFFSRSSPILSFPTTYPISVPLFSTAYFTFLIPHPILHPLTLLYLSPYPLSHTLSLPSTLPIPSSPIQYSILSLYLTYSLIPHPILHPFPLLTYPSSTKPYPVPPPLNKTKEGGEQSSTK